MWITIARTLCLLAAATVDYVVPRAATELLTKISGEIFILNLLIIHKRSQRSLVRRQALNEDSGKLEVIQDLSEHVRRNTNRKMSAVT